MKKLIFLPILFFVFLNINFNDWLIGRGFASENKILNETLDLDDAVKRALAYNPAVKAASLAFDESGKIEEASFAARLPKIDLEERVSRTTNPMWAFGTKLNQESISSADFNPSILNDPDPINNFSTILSLTMPLYSGGAIISQVELSKLKKEEAVLTLQGVRKGVIRNVVKAYYGLLLAKKNLKVVEQAISSAEANLSLVEARYGGGFSVKSDLLRAKVRLSALEQKKFKLQGCIKIARAKLNAVMGISPDHDNEIVDLMENLSPVIEGVDLFVSNGLKDRPEIKILELKRKMADKALAIVKSGHYPKLNAFANYEIDSNDPGFDGSNYTVGASLSLNLFNGNKINSKIKAVKLNLQRVNEVKKQQELRVEVEVRESFCRAMSAWEGIKVAGKTVTQAEESLRIIKNRYKNGLVTMVSLLDGDLALEEARKNYFQSMFDYHAAFTDLKWADGSININSK